MGFHRQRTKWLWRNPDNVTHRQLLTNDQVWRRSTALTWSRWGCRRLADNIWLLAHDNNNNRSVVNTLMVGLPYISSLQSKWARNVAKIPDKRLNSVLPGPWLRLPNSVTLPRFSDLYIGLKSTKTLNINVFLLPTKLLPLLNLLICTAWLFSPLVLHLLSPFLDVFYCKASS